MNKRQQKKQLTTPAAIAPPEPIKLVSVTRSYSRKLNFERVDPARKYESADFFASQTAYVEPGREAEASRALFKFVREEVIADYNAEIDFIQEEKVQRTKALQQGRG